MLNYLSETRRGFSDIHNYPAVNKIWRVSIKFILHCNFLR